MKVFEELGDNIVAVGVLVIIIVVIAILLINLKSTPLAACSDAGFLWNSTADNCYQITNTSNTTAISTLGSNINTAVTSVQTPISYITIIVLVIVFGAIIYYIVHKMRGNIGGSD